MRGPCQSNNLFLPHEFPAQAAVSSIRASLLLAGCPNTSQHRHAANSTSGSLNLSDQRICFPLLFGVFFGTKLFGDLLPFSILVPRSRGSILIRTGEPMSIWVRALNRKNPDCRLGSPTFLPFPSPPSPDQASWPSYNWKIAYICRHCARGYEYTARDIQWRASTFLDLWKQS